MAKTSIYQGKKLVKLVRRCFGTTIKTHKHVQALSSVDSILFSATRQNFLSDDQPLAMFFNLSHFNQRCHKLMSSFHDAGCKNIKHTVAVKALPLPKIFSHAKSIAFGVECASMGEINIALHSGMDFNDIVFDSPCKTMNELKYAINNNIHFNIDNFQELERVETIINQSTRTSISDNGHRYQYTYPGNAHNTERNIPTRNIGIRVNPAIGSGNIAVTSTATQDSKFGINIDQYYHKLYNYYIKYPWLNSIHCHIGSQGMSIDQIVQGIKKMVHFVETVNANRSIAACQDQSCMHKTNNLHIKTIDIGGGLPVNYETDEIKPTFDDFVKQLKIAVPVLFTKPNKYQIITEFGRSLVQKSGFVASKVEYTKQNGDKNIAIVHAGAQLFVRTAYQPHIWKHRISVHKPHIAEKNKHSQNDKIASDSVILPLSKQYAVGQLRGDDFGMNLSHSQIQKNMENSIDFVQYDIAGPLCFSGDYVARDVWLPRIEPGDYIVIHDSGGYCYGMFSRYNNRYAPPIYGYNDSQEIQLLKNGETKQNIVDFWS